jgi:AcrR family transcriptional regulator
MKNKQRAGSMGRIVKKPEVRRNEILDAAERLLVTKGYEQMAIRDLVDELQIANGTVYHYFESKQALLMALVERKGEQVEHKVLPLLSDRQIPAQDKLLRFFTLLDEPKRENLDLLFAFLRLWYARENVLFRQTLHQDQIKRLSPWLSQIIEQGVEEGVFTTPYPHQAARMIIALLEDLGDATAEFLLVEEGTPFDFPQMVQIGEATADALERVLGMKPGCLRESWSQDFSRWQALLA